MWRRTILALVLHLRSRTVLVCLLLAVGSPVAAQKLPATGDAEVQTSFGVGAAYMNVSEDFDVLYAGVSSSVFVGRHVAFSGSILVGRGQNEAIYVHFPLFTGLLFIFGDLYLNDSGIISSKGGLLALLMSDNIHYRFPLGRHVTVSPYVNVLGLEAGVKGRIHRRCTGGGGATDDIPGTPVVCTEVTEPPVLINLAGGGVQLVSRFGGRVELDLHVAGKQVYGQWDFDIANRHYFAYDLGVSARYVFR